MNENSLSLDAKQELIKLVFRFEDVNYWIDFSEREAVKYFSLFTLNKIELDKLKNHHIIVYDDEDGVDEYIIKTFKIYQLEIDSLLDVLDGSFEFRGAIDVGAENSMSLVARVKDFKAFELWAVDMMDDKEIAIVEGGKVVNKMSREIIQAGTQTYNSRYTFTFDRSII